MREDQKVRELPELEGFGLKITSPPPTAPKTSGHSTPHAEVWSRDPPPNDGLTRDCNRNLTFDDFVPPHQLGVDKQAKRMGATWDVVRAIVKLKRPLKRLRHKAEQERVRKVQPIDVDKERLLSDTA